MHAALDFKLQGKHDKALRLFEHAMALSPKHPEILTKYGEFLEHSQKDVITADLMYFQVLFFEIFSDGVLGFLVISQKKCQSENKSLAGF